MNEPEQMIPSSRRPKNQPSFPLTSTELEKKCAAWEKRALEAEDKLLQLEEKLNTTLCSVLGHEECHYDYGSYCTRCGEDDL